MAEVEALLKQFEVGLLPHERFAVSQGLVAMQWRTDDGLPLGVTSCAYMDEAVQRLRRDAHSQLGWHLTMAKGPKVGRMSGVDLPYGLYAPLLEWALVDLRLNVVSSFAGFALLLCGVAGEKALVLAPSLFASACFHPIVWRPVLVNAEALRDMAALHEALVAAQKEQLQLAA